MLRKSQSDLIRTTLSREILSLRGSAKFLILATCLHASLDAQLEREVADMRAFYME